MYHKLLKAQFFCLYVPMRSQNRKLFTASKEQLRTG